MRRMRGRGWMINAFLWVCPLTGMGAFVARLMAGKLPPPESAYEPRWFFDFPSAGAIVMLAAAMLLPLIVACATRRVVGFLAAISLVLLLTAAAAWLRSRWATDGAAICRVEKGKVGSNVHVWRMTSGERRLLLQRFEEERPVDDWFTRRVLLAPGRDQSISYSSGPTSDADGLYENVFWNTPQWLQRLGLGLTIKPEELRDPWSVGLTFALALPYWFLCLLAAPLPLAWLNRHRRRRRAARRAKAGACAKCGYDLRATPDPAGARLAVCPECGAVAGAKIKSI